MTLPLDLTCSVPFTHNFLRGSNVSLKLMETSDACYLKALYDDVGWIMEGSSYTPKTEQQLQALITSASQRYSIEPRFTVQNKSGDFVGVAKLYFTDTTSGVTYIAVAICTDHQRKGYGTEANRLLVDYAILHMNMRIVYAEVNGYNHPNIELKKKEGWELVATLPDRLIKFGQPYSLLIFSMTRDMWLTRTKLSL
mmetsp:Transcript_26802/g.91517  ORF Transcript_26802/g.91517 Transcript_26802/m.91517 type:complete len:196 (+) Transcript_26802:306-893(+)